jgi:DNA modification methylase
MGGKVNDLDPKRWREYEKDGLQFFTVWDSPERDPYGWTKYSIRGNSPVEIVRQCILRFSKQNDLVLDPFVGGGTTLIVCARLKRRGIGIEINPKTVQVTKKNFAQRSLDGEYAEWLAKQKVICDDARNLKKHVEPNLVDMVFAHPPYWDLINYSKEYGEVKGDLSNASFRQFLSGIKEVFYHVHEILKPGGFFCVLIGDAFKNGGKTIPLDHYATEVALDVGFEFYTKIVKITREATSRRNKVNIMKFRSLRNNFFICIHDYVIIFRKGD